MKIIPLAFAILIILLMIWGTIKETTSVFSTKTADVALIGSRSPLELPRVIPVLRIPQDKKIGDTIPVDSLRNDRWIDYFYNEESSLKGVIIGE